MDKKRIGEIAEENIKKEEEAVSKEVEDKDETTEETEETKEDPKDEETQEESEKPEEDSEEDDSEAEEEDSDDSTEDEAEESDVEEEQEVDSVPENLKQEIKKVWKEVPDVVQKAHLEAVRTQNILSSENGNLKKSLEAYEAPLRSQEAYLEKKSSQANVGRMEYMANLLSMEQELEINPDKTLMTIMSMYPPKNVVGMIQSLQRATGITNENLTQIDPTKSQMMTEKAEILAEKQKLIQQSEQREYEERLQRESNIKNAYENFKLNNPDYDEKDFESLIGNADSIFASNPNTGLDEVFNQAYKRLKPIDEQSLKEKAIEDYKRSQAKKVAKAKKASKSIGSRSPEEKAPKKRDYSTKQGERKAIEDIIKDNERKFG